MSTLEHQPRVSLDRVPYVSFVVLYPALYRIVIGSHFDVARTSHPLKYAIIGVFVFLYTRLSVARSVGIFTRSARAVQYIVTDRTP